MPSKKKTIKRKQAVIALIAVCIAVVFGVKASALLYRFYESSFISHRPTGQSTDNRETLKSASLELMPHEGEFLKGTGQYAMAILLNAAHVKVAGVDVKVRYNPKVVDVKNVVSGVSDSTILGKSIDSKEGMVSFSLLAPAKESLPNQEIATLVWTARAAGDALFDFEFSPGETVESNVAELGTGKDRLTSVVNARYRVLEK